MHPKRRAARPGRPLPVSVVAERRVVAEAQAWPTRGPRWVSARLARAGLALAPPTGWRVLHRHGRGTRRERLAGLEEQRARPAGRLTERTKRRRAGRHVAADQPGDLGSLDTFAIGTLQGVGKVWQLTACDAALSYGWARVVAGEVTAAVRAAFLVAVVGPGDEAAGWRLRRVVTDNGKAFQGAFAATCAVRGIRHTRTQPRQAWTHGFVERLPGTIVHAPWRVAFRRQHVTSLRQRQRSLDGFLRFSKTQRPPQGSRLRGQTPVTIFAGAGAA